MAHNFTVGRLGTAMLEADPDAVDAPMRRTRNGTYLGIGVGVLLCVGFLVFGLIFPGGATSWREEGRVIVDRESGATYLYADETLRPVDNNASARLIVGEGAQTSLVRQGSLEGVTVGGPIGIPGAPDALPKSDTEAAWRLCALEPTNEQESAHGRTALVVGQAPPPRLPDSDQTILVSGPGGDQYALWKGSRLRLSEETGGIQGLGYGTSPALPVSSAFLNAVPEGPDLVAPPVTGSGSSGPELAGSPRLVGQVFLVSTPDKADQHYLLTQEGLVPLTLTEALLLLTDTEVSEPAYGGTVPEAVPLSATEAHANLVDGGSVSGGAELPSSPPETLEVGARVPCLRWEADGTMTLTMDEPSGLSAWPVQDQPFVEPGCPTPDLVGIPSGQGGLVQARPVGGADVSPTHYLVTETAAKYPIADEGSLRALGYTQQDAVSLPTSLLRLLPTGPLLSQETASLPLTSSPRNGTIACP